MTVLARFVIKGRVQGVGFRFSTVKEAQRLGVCGTVRNLFDGSVEVVAEGLSQKVEALLSWCKRGPSFAEVTEVEVTFGESLGSFTNFTIGW